MFNEIKAKIINQKYTNFILNSAYEKLKTNCESPSLE